MRRKMLRRFVWLADHADIEVFDPVTMRRRGRQMPVVVRLAVDQHRLAPGRHDDPGIGLVRQRHEGLERRMRHEGQRAVVEETELLAPRRDQQMLEAAEGERTLSARDHGRDMVRVQLGQAFAHLGLHCGTRILPEPARRRQ